MSERNAGVTADPVFLGITRPPMRFGVTYLALVFNVLFTMEVFIVTRNLLVLLVALPIHGVCVLLCARDPRYFELLAMWGRTRFPAYVGSLRYWRGASYSPLRVDLPDIRGRRPRKTVTVSVT